VSDGQGQLDGYGLVLPFDTDDPYFVRGFALGMLWERLGHVAEADMSLSVESAEMVVRIAEARGCMFTAEDLGGGWMSVHLVRS
jgi:hypothetical protein